MYMYTDIIVFFMVRAKLMQLSLGNEQNEIFFAYFRAITVQKIITNGFCSAEENKQTHYRRLLCGGRP